MAESRPITYQEVFQNTNNGVVVTDAAGVVVRINRKAQQVLGFDGRREIGRQVCELLPLTGPQVMACLESGQPMMGHQVMGKRVELVVNITLVRRSGNLQGAVCTFQELGEFETAAKKLDSYRKLNRQFETMFKASFDGLWVCNGQGRVINVNQASARLNGIDPRDVIGKDVAELVQLGLFDRSVTLEVLETKRQVSLMQYIQKTDRFLLATGTPAFDDNGEIYLVVVNERDMTDLNQMREELEQSQLVYAKIRDELAELSMLELRHHEIVAESKAMRHVLQVALKLARIGASNILILGESGTGKGLVAKFIHQSSERNRNPFIQINCAALPEGLLEAELFGYEKGAFTGAREQGKAGLFELAHGGTLFLDEIGDLPLSVQAKLLKCLDDQEILRLGATQPRRIDALVVAATNLDLEEQVRKKRFRRDLFYRLNTFNLRIPPLRERPDDLFELVHHFLRKYNRVYNTQKRIHNRALELLRCYAFLGNVRELENIIKRAVVMSEAPVLDDFLQASLRAPEKVCGEMETVRTPRNGGLKEDLLHCEREVLRNAMRDCRTTRELAAKLGSSQPTIVRKMKKHGLAF